MPHTPDRGDLPAEPVARRPRARLRQSHQGDATAREGGRGAVTPAVPLLDIVTSPALLRTIFCFFVGLFKEPSQGAMDQES